MNRQTVIPLEINDDANFQSFHAGRNQILIEQLKQLIDGTRDSNVIYLWGESGSGKTHLLDACCATAERQGAPGRYVSLAQESAHQKSNHQRLGQLEKLSKLAPSTLVCLDDLENIAGLSDPEKQIFGLYERVINAGGALVVSGSVPLHSINIVLKDLESRLSSGGSYHLLALNDEEKCAALKANAKKRGFTLEDNVVTYIMTHFSRDAKTLFALMDKLDAGSLREQRKITIPFLKTFF